MENFLNAIGYISTIVAIIDVGILLISGLCGVLPLLWRLGIGRWRTKIAIFSNDISETESITRDLTLSGLIRKGNVTRLNEHDLQRLSRYTIVIICGDIVDMLDEILSKLSCDTGIIVYTAAQKEELSSAQTALLERFPLATLVNFRGRLINDVLMLLMSTVYAKKQNR